jgi:amidase
MAHRRALERLGALEAARLIAAGEIRSRELVEACLSRIEAREDIVGAWAFVDGEQALAEAGLRDQEEPRSVLHGVPVAVKDVIDTADLPTAYGSPIYDGHRPTHDAACVAALRAAGMVVLGKSVATEFGHRTPGKTRNPHAIDRTPGGSSSGSAAAVADRMAPLGIGTQTGGSIIRPAAYCGVVGYKPTFGAIDRAGIRTLCEAFDTVGVMARSVADAASFAGVLSRRDIAPDEPTIQRPFRIGLCRTDIWAEASEDCRSETERATARLAAAGAEVPEIDLPSEFERVPTAYRMIANFEGARALGGEMQSHPGKLSPALRAMVADGAAISADEHADAMGMIDRCRRLLERAFAGCDVLITPSAPGVAPVGLADIGSAKFNSLWSALGTPCVTVPLARGGHDLPLGVQVIGRFSEDARLLSVARWIESELS